MADMSNPTMPQMKPLDGSTSIDDKMRFGPLRLSYASARTLAKRIAEEVVDRLAGRPVVIANGSILADLSNLQAAYVMLAGLEREYQAIVKLASPVPHVDRQLDRAARDALPRTAATIGTAALVAGTAAVANFSTVGAVLSGALGVISLFRQDVEFRGTETAVDTLAFEIATGSALKDIGTKGHRDLTVVVPDLMVLPPVDESPGSLHAHMAAVEAAKASAWSAAAPLVAQLASLEAQLDLASKHKDEAQTSALSAEIAATRRRLDPIAVPLERADQRYSDLQVQWTRTDAQPPPLTRMLRAEALRALRPVYLHCAVIASGGHHRITRSLVRTMFTGDGLSFSGGTIARWTLLSADGGIEVGGIFEEHQTESA
jgi:hypothetical protein